MKMKRSQLKDLIKECLVEILQEDLILKRAAVGAVHESNIAKKPVDNHVINPFDDNAMVARQKQISNQLVKQKTQKRSPDYFSAAGSNIIEGEQPSAAYYSRNDHGYDDPSVHLKRAVQQSRRFDPMLDANVHAGQISKPMTTSGNVRENSSSEIGVPSPDILRQMFDDTAKTTFLEQAAVESVRPGHSTLGQQVQPTALTSGDRYAKIAATYEPDELFEGSQNWASLAFDK